MMKPPESASWQQSSLNIHISQKHSALLTSSRVSPTRHVRHLH
uniref:Uncharacterized protein n=1 Tax=Anguilla anguilla TaxID=7936 RepID=A0A0E9VWA5_ANGAN